MAEEMIDGEALQETNADGKVEEQEEKTVEALHDEVKEEKPKRKRDRTGRLISKLTYKAKSAEERVARLEKEIADLKSTRNDSAEEPDPKDFGEYDDYLRALGDWRKQTKGNFKKETRRDDKVVDIDEDLAIAQDELMNVFEDASKRFEDFEKVFVRDSLPVTREMIIALADTEDPTAVAYYLGTHERTAERISRLGPVAQAMEIAKLDSKLGAKEVRHSKAPDPIKPVSGKGGAVQKRVEDMSFSEYEEYANRKESEGSSPWV